MSSVVHDGAWDLTLTDRPLVEAKRLANRLRFAVMLLFFRARGRFPRAAAEVDGVAISKLARSLGVPEPSLAAPLMPDAADRTTERQRAEIRALLGFREAGLADAEALGAWLRDHAVFKTRDPARRIDLPERRFRGGAMKHGHGPIVPQARLVMRQMKGARNGAEQWQPGSNGRVEDCRIGTRIQHHSAGELLGDGANPEQRRGGERDAPLGIRPAPAVPGYDLTLPQHGHCTPRPGEGAGKTGEGLIECLHARSLPSFGHNTAIRDVVLPQAIRAPLSSPWLLRCGPTHRSL